DEDPMEGWEVWLLTRNSPYTVRDIATTNASGEFLFGDLPYGTYYVCQDLIEGRTQTQRPAGNSGVSSDTPGIGDELDLTDALVAEYCYEVELTPEESVVANRDFGNFNTILGATDDRTDDGEVLGDTDGEVLGKTGNPALYSILIGTSLIALPLALTRRKLV
ncbi:MAG: hypothetical protein R3313_01020, partial [Candidatus Saccharimonadales bacterium]|nr:hypothetical protein [Candidatus Saccharimonadales bacterium]